MANIRINYENNTIEINSKFAKEASMFGSEQYKELKEARADFPTFEIKVIKKVVNTSKSFKGMTVNYMEKYIRKHNGDDSTEMKEFNVLRGKANSEDEITARASFGEIKMWFLNTYPEFEKTRSDIEDIMKKVKEKRENKKTA